MIEYLQFPEVWIANMATSIKKCSPVSARDPSGLTQVRIELPIEIFTKHLGPVDCFDHRRDSAVLTPQIIRCITGILMQIFHRP